MSANGLRQRIERLQPAGTRPYILVKEDGESDADVEQRAAMLGCPVAIMPRSCATTEEWEQTYGGRRGQ
jgi:hypothetical protein